METRSEQHLARERQSRSARKKRSESNSLQMQAHARNGSTVQSFPITTHMHSKQQSTFYGTGVEESNANEGTGSKDYYSVASQIGKEKASGTSSAKGRSS